MASEADTPDAYRLGEVSDTYYERMDVQLAEGVSITSPEGRRLSPSDVSVGTTVDVWIEGGCEESFPVQCEVTAVQVVAG